MASSSAITQVLETDTAGGSGTIQNSLVLPGLEIALIEEALNRSQTEDDGEINRWLIQTFSQG